MTLDEFVSKYDGRGLDWDGAYGFQCVDVYRAYTKEVLGAKQSPAVPGAKDVWSSYLTDVFSRVSNSPTNAPKPGDVVIWGTELGPYGHIAICVQADSNNFASFDQNFPLGTVCHLQKHSYFGVLGWLHPKNAPTPPVMTPEEPIDPDKIKVDLGSELGVWEIQAVRSEILDLRKNLGVEKKAREEATKENKDLLDYFWDRLAVLGKEKNWPNVKGEFEGMLIKEDQTGETNVASIGLIQWFIGLFNRKRGEK